jgi:HIV Tat-specific factor 1
MSELDDFIDGMGGGGRSHSGTPPADAPVADPQTSNNNKKRKAGKQAEVSKSIRFVSSKVVRVMYPASSATNQRGGNCTKLRANTAQVTKKPKTMENKAIWISNLPPYTTKQELEDEFCRFGIIDKGADGDARINLYTDKETGEFNGTAMIKYFKKESIALAINMMDDYYLRPGDTSHGTIKVQEADLNYKKEKDGDTVASKLTRKDRKASEKNRADLNRKLAEWSDNEEEVAQAFAPKKNKWAKVVIIKGAFTFEDLEEDDAAYLEIKEDMREAAEKFGDVTNCTLYDKEKDGYVTVRFKEFEPAEKFVEAFQGKGYSKRKLQLSIAEDKPRFKKTARGEVQEAASEED